MSSTVQSKGTIDCDVSLTDAQFNDAYRGTIFLLKVPWLLIELTLVMKLPKGVTASKALMGITGSATAGATHHCGRILDPGVDAFSAVQSQGTGDYVVSLTDAHLVTAIATDH